MSNQETPAFTIDWLQEQLTDDAEKLVKDPSVREISFANGQSFSVQIAKEIDPSAQTVSSVTELQLWISRTLVNVSQAELSEENRVAVTLESPARKICLEFAQVTPPRVVEVGTVPNSTMDTPVPQHVLENLKGIDKMPGDNLPKDLTRDYSKDNNLPRFPVVPPASDPDSWT